MEKKTSNNWVRDSIGLKLLLIVSLSLLLLIPAMMVRKLIDEREDRQEETINEVTKKWGQAQTVCGPVLIVPFGKHVRHSNGNTYYEKDYFNILPSDINIEGDIIPSTRKRGIFSVITYAGDIELTGTFKAEDLEDMPESYTDIFWEDATLSIGITDLRGIREQVEINWNEDQLKSSVGTGHTSIFNNGISANCPIDNKLNHSFNIKLALNGSESIYFIPTGNNTKVHLESTWATPSFNGYFLPQDHNVTDSGFVANWSVLEMNRNFPQKWVNNEVEEYHEWQKMQMPEYSKLNPLGVDLLVPVDHYQKSTRSVKYALLFIGLTFLVIFFTEIIGKKRVHFIQYLIVGSALVIFYSLLIALAEHISFNLAYLIGSLVIIGMISVYIHSIFKKINQTIAISSVLVLLYVFLFTILQISDLALLIGNVGLVLVLGLVMFFSRKINWYSPRAIENDTEN